MKFRLYDIRSIRLLYVFDIVLVVIIIFCGVFFRPFFDIPTYIFGGVLILCILTQIILYFFSGKFVFFDEIGIEFISRKNVTKIVF